MSVSADLIFAALCFGAGFLAGLAVRAPAQTTVRGVLWVSGLAATACSLWLVYIVRVVTNADHMGPILRTVTVTGLVLWAAWTLWRLRQRQRIGYGIAEILFGLAAVGYLAFAQISEPLTTALSLAASAYVIVRGLDNIEVGLMQPQHEPLSAAFGQLRERFRRRPK